MTAGGEGVAEMAEMAEEAEEAERHGTAGKKRRSVR